MKNMTCKTEALKLEPHMLRHRQNTELFRLGVDDTIISKRVNRRSVVHNYEYGDRSVAEYLDQIDSRRTSTSCSTRKPARLPGASRTAIPTARSLMLSGAFRQLRATLCGRKRTASMPRRTDTA
ncbi:hypothetical protein [Paraburkholderia domus]|uniref:hypothetical protein n=1 Tax=Paraburkholderia domus TaxID=2793075 RepID=UPI001EEF7F30|nr:hypothetical protein [Paraburkholderia domus]